MGHNWTSSNKFLHLYRKWGGDGDASARATHLKAATENVFVTTIERKKMSNKTTFKRVALAVVGILGVGLLSASPATATVSSFDLSVTRSGTATTTVADSTTAAIISASGFFTTTADTITVTFTEDNANRPLAGAGYDTSVASVKLRWGIFETVNALSKVVTAANLATTLPDVDGAATFNFATTYIATTSDSVAVFHTGANSTASMKFWVQADSTGTLGYGTYNVKAVATAYSNTGTAETKILPFTITVATPAAVTAAAVKTIDPSKSIAVMNGGATARTSGTDSPIAVVATAAGTDHATIAVRTYNASDVLTAESVTATITGAGLLCDGIAGTACGTSLSLDGAGGSENITVRANGSAGVATITITTPTVTFPSKTVVFFAKDPATVVATVEKPVIKTGSGNGTDAIAVDAKDANGNVWGGQAYLVSSDTTIATEGTCTFDTTDKLHYCSVVGVKAGETKFKIRNGSTAALSTVTSAEFAGPRVTSATVASLKIEFDKAAYAPGEKARIYVTALDKDGKLLAGDTYTNAFATGGITSSVAFSSGSDTITSVSVTTSPDASATTGAKAGAAMYTVYMPFSKGTITLTAKGGASLPVAGQVALTASASVVDDSVDAAVDAAQEATDAAIAATDAAILAQEAADEAASAAIAAQETAQAAVDAVTALSAEVTKLVAQLATLQKLLNRVAKRVGVKL
jgi:hypothetical protein